MTTKIYTVSYDFYVNENRKTFGFYVCWMRGGKVTDECVNGKTLDECIKELMEVK